MEEEKSAILNKSIKIRFDQVKGRIKMAATNSSRDPDDITLIVVTKSKSLEVVKALINAGCKNIGESYMEEALQKIGAIDSKDVSWHMIGHIQSRKAKMVCGNFDWVHSLDRLKIAKRLNSYMQDFGNPLPVLLECNVSGEKSKYGFPAWDESIWSELAITIENLIELSNLEIRGLMTIPPWDSNPEKSRPYYQKLRLLGNYLKEKFPKVNWVEYSMGMSNDFIVAIEEGSTMVRIGTEIVGERG